MVFSNHCDRAGVLGTIAAATFAVVIRGVRIEAGAAVARIAFAGFRFPFFGFFGFDRFPFFRFDLGGFLPHLPSSCLTPRRSPRGLPPLPRFCPARFASKALFPAPFCRNPCLARSLSSFLFAAGVRARPTARPDQHDAKDDHTCQDPHSFSFIP